MPPILLLPALQFWVSKFVLHETSPDTYTVRETLSALDLESSTANPSAFSAAGASFSAAGGGKSAEEIMMEKMEEFWPYIVGMLTNQGQMKAGKIVTLLKFVVPGGFPLGVEEVREFMRAKVEERKCEMVGGAYKIVK
jgi:anaphase-promoting complex subunit 2